jgi:carboxymethylenebutenolidase
MSSGMLRTNIKIRSKQGPEFDCHLVTPESGTPIPAVVLASAIRGVDRDLRGIADAFATRGYIAAAPDLFWRTVPGPLARNDPRAVPRGQPRLEKIRIGEQDLADVLRELRKQPLFNGRAAVIGFCYGGPYAILGPKRLGYDAGMSCHGSRMLDYINLLEGVQKPVCLVWGDQDHLAPVNVLDAYRAVPACMKNVDIHVLPGVRHGYMMQGKTEAFDQQAYASSMECALAILDRLRDGTDARPN